MTDDFSHIPVLPSETVELMCGACGGHPRRIIDGTVGCGGHSALLLKALPDAEVLGIDRDADALLRSEKNLAFAGDRVTLVKGTFSELADRAAEHGWDTVDAILLDIGVSSPQIDDPSRGFSFKYDGPLDMRMDRESPLSASRVLNNYSAQELAGIFMNYGELDRRQASILASAVVEQRRTSPFGRTSEFAELCDRVIGRKRKRGGLPAPTLPFQALRIEVNGELAELTDALEKAVGLLAPGGRICVISFHSLEDRIVKNFFRDMAENCKCPPGLPVCVCGWKKKLEVLTRHPVTASDAELERNGRAGCAKLRAAGKL